jgi:hypothetical protein
MKTFLYLLLAVVANSNDLKICSLDTFGITDGEGIPPTIILIPR